MRKLITLCLGLAVAATASAEGYQVNTFSAKQEGMGHVGVGMKLGSESLIFNPGAVAFMDKTMEISGALSAISSTVDCTYGGNVYTTNNKVSTPMNVSAAFRIYDNLYGGVTLFTPYGSSINWGKNWPGSVLNQSVDLKIFTVQPTLSWRVFDKLSIGAGLMVAWGNVNLNKGLVDNNSYNKLIGLLNYQNKLQGQPTVLPTLDPGVTPASVNISGNSAIALGFNVGAMLELNDKINIGASFRSKMEMHVKAGDVAVEYANDIAAGILQEELNNLNATNFDASMPAPYVFTVGVSYKPIKQLTLAFDAQLNGWKTYEYLDLSFANQEKFNQHLKKDYKNTMTYHIGAQYAMTKRLDLRAGLMIDTNPCNLEYYNPETPGTTKIEPSVGLSFRPIKGLSVDVAFMYVGAKKVNGATGRFDDFIAAKYNPGVAALDAALSQFGMPASGLTPLPAEGTFTADYKVKAVIPAIGVSYSF